MKKILILLILTSCGFEKILKAPEKFFEARVSDARTMWKKKACADISFHNNCTDSKEPRVLGDFNSQECMNQYYICLGANK